MKYFSLNGTNLGREDGMHFAVLDDKGTWQNAPDLLRYITGGGNADELTNAQASTLAAKLYPKASVDIS